MDTIELRAVAARLVKLHVRFAPCFRRRECREHSLGYLRGLLLAEGRKSVEPMALLFAGPAEEEPNINQGSGLATLSHGFSLEGRRRATRNPSRV
jgi:hypothetical protein